jgi:Tol biopolymer transport system component
VSDGSIVFRSITGDDVGLWQVSRDGRKRTQLAKGSVNFPMTGGDGTEIVFSSPATGMQTVWHVSMNGGAASPLFDTPIGILGFSNVSPDGRSFAVAWPGDQWWSVCDYPKCTTRTPLPIRGSRVRWTSDGRALSFIDVAETNVWIQPTSGGPPRQVTLFTDGRTLGHYAWSPDGRRLAVSRASLTSDIVLFSGLTAASTETRVKTRS